MKNGWIHLHRKLLDNPIADNPELAWCWVRFLLEASHKPHSILIGLQKVTLLPGQFIWGEKAFGKKLNISSSKARRLKNILKNEEQIEEQVTNKYTLITIVNWEKYQVLEEQSDEQVKSKRRASEEQVKTNKNVKNVKNVNKDTSEIKISGDYSLQNEITKLTSAPRRDRKIVGYYLQQSKLDLPTRAVYQKTMPRLMKSANILKDYETEKIKKAFRVVQEQYPDWTLETVVKTIQKI